MSAERSAWISTWLPGLEQLRGYRRGWLRGDLLAGITVAAYLVPQIMAYAVVAGLPPVTGLWATIGPLGGLRGAGELPTALRRPRVDHGADDGRAADAAGGR